MVEHTLHLMLLFPMSVCISHGLLPKLPNNPGLFSICIFAIFFTTMQKTRMSLPVWLEEDQIIFSFLFKYLTLAEIIWTDME